MSKNTLIFILCLVVAMLALDKYVPQGRAIIRHYPKRGAILRYENYKGYRVPIKANGSGGWYRWIGDVPWDAFTIEEKFDMARVNGGYLNEKDIAEIRQKYTKR